jgi:hypothetical protein
LLAVGGQGDLPVRSGAQERGADGGLELADLAGEDGVPDAELAGRVVEAGLAGKCEEPADALLGVRAGEGIPDGRRELVGCGAMGTVLALPQVRVSARWISCLYLASIEMWVTGMAGTAGHRRHPDARIG